MRPALLVPGMTATLVAGSIGACVLQDVGIVVIDENVQNKHPVRFVEPTPVTNEAANLCLATLVDMKQANSVCQPGDPSTSLPHFLDPEYEPAPDYFPYDFCSCDKLESDTQKLSAVTLYIEDRANNIDDGLDPIYAALQLDLRPDDTEPQQAVAYQSYVDPSVALTEPSELAYAPPLRPNEAAGRELRALYLGSTEDQMDLCNGTGAPLARGFHTLRVIVTDSPWFTPPGMEDGRPPLQQDGVPDLAGGATYDTLTYIFHCDDITDEHCESQCVVPE